MTYPHGYSGRSHEYRRKTVFYRHGADRIFGATVPGHGVSP